jgi:hypothetical protein
MLPTPSFRAQPSSLFSRERRKQRLDAFLDAFNRQTRPAGRGDLNEASGATPRFQTTRAAQSNAGGR